MNECPHCHNMFTQLQLHINLMHIDKIEPKNFTEMFNFIERLNKQKEKLKIKYTNINNQLIQIDEVIDKFKYQMKKKIEELE